MHVNTALMCVMPLDAGTVRLFESGDTRTVNSHVFKNTITIEHSDVFPIYLWKKEQPENVQKGRCRSWLSL